MQLIHPTCVVLLLIPFAACETDKPPAAPAASVVYVGDSIAVETSSVLAAELTTAAIPFVASAKGGMAICDFFPESEDEGGEGTFRTWDTPIPPNLHDLVITRRPTIIVMQFWGNSWQYTPCMKRGDEATPAPGTDLYFERYAADAERAMVVIRDAAASINHPMPVVSWVLQGPDQGNPTRPETLNAIYTALAQRWETADVIDAGREVSLAANYYEPGDRYGFAQWLPCTPLESETGHCDPAFGGVAKIHKDDDGVHFCLGTVDATGVCDTWSPGIYRYALAIGAAVRDVVATP